MTRFSPTLVANCGQLKKRGRLLPLFGLLALVAVPWVRPVIADGDEPRISYSEMRTSGRPGDFYNLGFGADNKVCHDALQLLNTPAPIPPGLRTPHDYAKIDTAFFLWTSANVAWEPKWLITAQSANGRAGVLDVTTADVFNNGTPLRLLRFELSVASNLSHSLYAVSAQTLKDHLVQSGQSSHGLSAVILATPLSELTPYKLDFDPSFVSNALSTGDHPWAGVFADIIEIDGKVYLAVTSALEKYRRNHAYLVEFLSHKDRKLICEYRSEYTFVDD